MTKHVAIYMRVSTEDQSHASQRPDLEHWAEGQDEPCEWYCDKFTGTTMERPEWDKLQSAIQRGKVSQVVIWRIDRLGRTARGLTALFEELLKRKVNLVSIKDMLDLGTPAGRLMAHVLASVAQYEHEVRSERQMAGIAAAKAAGKRWGGSKKGRRISVEDEQVALVHRLHRDGEKIATIAKTTGLSRPTVYRLLKENIASQPPSKESKKGDKKAKPHPIGEQLLSKA